MGLQLDIEAELNAQEDDGLGWSTLADATDPAAEQSARSSGTAANVGGPRIGAHRSVLSRLARTSVMRR